jgi:hypothetical protein
MTDPFGVNRIRLMSSVVLLRIWAQRGARVLLAVSIAAAGVLVWRAFALLRDTTLEPAVERRASSPALTWPQPAALQEAPWWRFRGRLEPAARNDTPLERRLRLAGTFFEFTAAGSDSRVAIIDNLPADTQLLVREGEDIDDVTVLRILRDRVVVRGPSGEEVELRMSFTRDGGTGSPTGGDRGADPALSRFGGKREGERRWSFERQALLDYYQELRDQPERLVLLFDSLKPVYRPDGRGITGYRLGVEGEGDFFKAVGIREGDVVRRVNTVPMTDRRRAEYFITQLVEGRASAFFLDVERGGSTNRFTYQVR